MILPIHRTDFKHFSRSVLAMAFATLLGGTALAYSTTTQPPEQNSSNGELLSVQPSGERIILPTAPDADTRPTYQNLPVQRDLSALPFGVAAKRDALLKAARSGDVEKFRDIIKRQAGAPVLSFGGTDDPVNFLRDSSNDGEGRELLAIMIELLEAPYALVPAENGDPDIYVWPAYATSDLIDLPPEQLVDVYKIVSHLDLEEMQLFGGWYFYRVGIDAHGEWRYFVAGD